jgi:hypothetical protein
VAAAAMAVTRAKDDMWALYLMGGGSTKVAVSYLLVPLVDVPLRTVISAEAEVGTTLSVVCFLAGF